MAAPRAREMTLKTGISVDTTYGGELLPEQGQEFINYLSSSKTIFGYADVQTMMREKQLVERAGFTTRISHVDTPGTASDPSKYADFTRALHELDAQWFKAISRIDYRTSKINIMGGGLGTFLRDEMTRQVGLDQSDNVINGNLLSSDEDLAAFDGLVVQAKANGNAYEEPGDAIDICDDVFFSLINMCPDGYDEDPENKIFLMSRKMEVGYARWLKANEKVATGNFIDSSRGMNPRDRIEFLGAPCRVEAKMPNDTIIYTHAKNIAIGVFVQLYLELDHQPDPGVDLYIMRYALDTKYKRPEGVTIYSNISNGITSGTTG